MNKKADVEISEPIRLLLYLGTAIIVILIIIFLVTYLFNDIDLGNLFRLS